MRKAISTLALAFSLALTMQAQNIFDVHSHNITKGYLEALLKHHACTSALLRRRGRVQALYDVPDKLRFVCRLQHHKQSSYRDEDSAYGCLDGEFLMEEDKCKNKGDDNAQLVNGNHL